MKNRIDAEIIRLNPDMPLPGYATEGSAAIDLFANIHHDIVLFSGEKVSIGTGLKIWHKDSAWAGLILPRSGAGSNGLVLKNLVGLIDSDYQGELIVTAWNSNDTGSITIPGYKSGKAFAQYVMVPVGRLYFQEVQEFGESTERGAGGFGHTDAKAKS
jgi:dUTP pyrophosphatase